METFDVPVNTESLTVKLRTYVPAWLNDTVVAAALALANVIVPGPLAFVHAYVNAPGGLG